MTIFQRNLLLVGLFGCTLLVTSCNEEPTSPSGIAVNGSTLKLTQGYLTTTSSVWNEQVWYRHNFLLLGKELVYDTTRLDFSGRGDMANFTIITSTPELPDGTYALVGNLDGGEALENIFFVRDFYRVHNPDPEAIENLWTDFFAERFWPREGNVEITKTEDSYTITFNFSMYILYEDSDNETETEMNEPITGTYTGKLNVWQFQ